MRPRYFLKSGKSPVQAELNVVVDSDLTFTYCTAPTEMLPPLFTATLQNMTDIKH